MARPYNETLNEKEGYVLREFSHDTPSFEYVWHRDKEDRYIESTHTKRNISSAYKRNW